MFAATASSTKTHRLAALLGWRRVSFSLVVALLMALALSPFFVTSWPVLMGRTTLAALLALLAFGGLEHWPLKLPRWLPRWALQATGATLAVPLGLLLAYLLATGGKLQSFWSSEARLIGFAIMASAGLFWAPLLAMSALLSQRDAQARSQQLAFELERSELERRAVDARLRLLQAQVEPHFLFNTLANVRALVDAGSPQASEVLGSLIAYLRAAVPRLQQPSTTLGQELELVRAYLALMQLRMPDRLQHHIDADASVMALQCPPMSLLTLVENAVQHGIDPSEEGGSIEVEVRLRGQQVLVRVEDSGVGLGHEGLGLGTGLETLRERLQLAFGEQSQLRLVERLPHGVRAEIEFPAQRTL